MNIGQIILFVSLGASVALVFVLRERLANFFAGLREFYDEVVVEMKKVAWPTKESVVNSTVVVGLTTVGMVVVVGFMDKGLGFLVKQIFTGQ